MPKQEAIHYPRFLQCPTFPLNAITFGRPLSRFPGALSCFVATEHSHTATSCCTHGSVGFAWIRCSRLRSSCTRSRRRVNKQYCMRTAYVGAVRIRIPRRGLVVGTSIESGSRHYRLLFAEDDFFSTTLCVFVFHPPAFYHLSLVHSLSLSLSIFISVSTSVSISVPFFLSTTRRFLRQVLCTYIKSLLPVGLCVLAVRFKEIDSSSLYDVLSSRVNIESTLVLVETRWIAEDTNNDFYLCCFFRAWLSWRGRARQGTGSALGSSAIPGHTTCGVLFGDKGPPDTLNRVGRGSV